ncbi:MAG: LamG domain-containing protein [Bacteroidales bacterium]|nr:LamG domain-containing protein [Bacteroidales bacterium]
MKTHKLFLLLIWLTISGYCQYPFENLVQTFYVPAGGFSNNNPQGVACNDSYLFLVKLYDNTKDTVYVYEIMTGNLIHAETMNISGVSGGSYGVVKTTNNRLFCGGDFYSLYAYDISDLQNWSLVDSLKDLDKGFLRQWDNDNNYIAWGGHWAQTYQIVDISSGILDAKCKVNTGGNNYMGGRYGDFIYVANADQQNKKIDISDPQNCTTSNFGNSKSVGVWITESGFVVYHANYLNPARIAIFDQNNNLLDELVGDEWRTELLIDNLFIINNTSTQTRVLCDISDSTFSQIIDTLDYNEIVGYCHNDQYLFKYYRDNHYAEVYFLGDCNISINLPDTIMACQQDSIVLDAGAGFVDYLWSTGDTTQTLAVFQTGTYAVTVEDAFGCAATDSTYVNIINVHIAQNDTTICAGESIELSVTGGGPANITEGLEAWYPFNGGADDESGNGHHGTVYGATLAPDRFGNFNSAYLFDGSDDYITIGNQINPGINDFSISVWVKTFGSNDGQIVISKRYDYGSPVCMPYIVSIGTDDSLSFIFRKGDYSILTRTDCEIGKWNHFVLIRDGGTSKIFKNGNLVSIDSNINLENAVLSNTQITCIGKSSEDNTRYFNGFIDDIRIFYKALSTEEIQSLYREYIGNYSFLWSTGDTTASITVTPAQTTTYYVEITDGINWCTDSVTVTVENALALELKVNLEGPWFSSEMTPFLNAFGFLPLSQPYNNAPWNYQGTEAVAAIPNPDIIDWILVELRETSGDASTANSDSIVGIQAGFLLKDGTVTATDGISNLVFNHEVQANLYAVVWHRNHLGIMSNFPLTENNGTYSYDFTSSGNQVYGGSLAHKEMSAGVWAIVAADGNADKQVNNNDKNEVWIPQAGLSGYYAGDFDMNSQVDNNDKNDLWVPNSGRGAQVPDSSPDKGYKCMVPE